MIPSKVLGLKVGSSDHKEPPRPQKLPILVKNIKNGFFVFSPLGGETIAIRVAINCSISIKWSQVRFLELDMGFQSHKLHPWLQKWPRLTKSHANLMLWIMCGVKEQKNCQFWQKTSNNAHFLAVLGDSIDGIQQQSTTLFSLKLAPRSHKSLKLVKKN